MYEHTKHELFSILDTFLEATKFVHLIKTEEQQNLIYYNDYAEPHLEIILL